MATDLNPLIAVVIDELPAVVGAIKSAFASRHPDQPEPTSEEVVAAFNAAYGSSLAKDHAWEVAHPDPDPTRSGG